MRMEAMRHNKRPHTVRSPGKHKKEAQKVGGNEASVGVGCVWVCVRKDREKVWWKCVSGERTGADRRIVGTPSARR